MQDAFIVGQLLQADLGHGCILQAPDEEGILMAEKEEPEYHEHHVIFWLYLLSDDLLLLVIQIPLDKGEQVLEGGGLILLGPRLDGLEELTGEGEVGLWLENGGISDARVLLDREVVRWKWHFNRFRYGSIKI